ncbi:ADP-L-glycero-D-manno-heptose-6-epimerase [hydrothermal vent metagenome]|uniref:ADP-L-glycero-D-manno-heptose-6-epimerase n=1 Tax=hydrothermal vent metagenome TaxID=652676 RepID=A0A1W1BI23_9ZZZZ
MKYTDEELSGKSILITGGAGFIGANLAFYFQEHHPKSKVVILDKFRSEDRFSNGNLKSFGHFKNLIGFKGEVVSGDINDPKIIDRLNSDYRFDYIFHEAAISDTTVLEQDLMIKTNVNAFKELLNLALSHKANIVYASSAATYGDAPSPQSVGREAPNNAYGFSKLMMDNIANEYIEREDEKSQGISIVGLRYFNVYGAREYFKDKTASTVIQFGHQMMAGEIPKLFEGSDKILRDFIYIEDVIQANIKAMNPKKSGIFNVGTGRARSFQDICDILQDELQIPREATYIPNPYIGRYQFHTEADISNTKEILGYRPMFELEDGIRDYLPEIERVYQSEVANG